MKVRSTNLAQGLTYHYAIKLMRLIADIIMEYGIVSRCPDQPQLHQLHLGLNQNDTSHRWEDAQAPIHNKEQLGK